MRLSAERGLGKADDQEYDFLQRHVRFIEDFTKEGREIKQELKMHRNMQASPIAQKDKLFSNQRKTNLQNTNIRQVLGQHFALDKVRSRYPYQASHHMGLLPESKTQSMVNLHNAGPL